MAEDEYILADESDPPDEHVVLQLWLRSREGALLVGATYERGPFDTLAALAAEVLAVVPWELVQHPQLLRRQFVQQRLF